jgi:hypothetical protein
MTSRSLTLVACAALFAGCFDSNMRNVDAAVVPTDAPFSCEGSLEGRWRLDFDRACRRESVVVEGLPFATDLDCTAEGCNASNCFFQSASPPLCQHISRFTFPCIAPRGVSSEVVAQVISSSRVDVTTLANLDGVEIRCSYRATRVP